MTEKKKITVGKAATDLYKNFKDNTHCAEEQMRENLTEYEKNINLCIQNSLKKFNGDFYVTVLIKKERLFKNVIRHYFLGRESCPTPEYDQIVYKYDRKNDNLAFLWVIPSLDNCQILYNNPFNLDYDEKALLKMVLDFYDGTLLRLAQTLNGEIILN